MRIIDLTRPGEEQSIGFHEHYARFWAREQGAPAELAASEMEQRKLAMIEHLRSAEQVLVESGVDTSSITAILAHGDGGANGHALLLDTGAAAWYALECYTNVELMRVFAMHELLHAVHYLAQPSLAFHSESEQHNVARLTVTEGVATFLTSRLLGVSLEQSLWADTLPEQELREWIADCRERESEIAVRMLSKWDTTEHEELFYASQSRDVLLNRAGYFVAARAIERLVERRPLLPKQLLLLDTGELLAAVREELQQTATRGSESKSGPL